MQQWVTSIAVGQEFVLNVNDIVYFSGLIEGLGEFYNDQGLEIVVNELPELLTNETSVEATTTLSVLYPMNNDGAVFPLMAAAEDGGNTNYSLLLSDEEESLRIVNLMTGTYMVVFLFLESTPQLHCALILFRPYPRSSASHI